MEVIARTITKTRCYEVIKVNQTSRDCTTLGMIISVLRDNYHKNISVLHRLNSNVANWSRQLTK